MNTLANVLVSVATWLSPMPVHAHGLIVSYGSNRLMHDQFWVRGYTREGYAGGLAAASPSMLGRVAWVRTHGAWVGPLLVVDVMARHDFYRGVYVNGEIAEVSDEVRLRLGIVNGAIGEVYFGLCPPPPDRNYVGIPYTPPLTWDMGNDRQPLFWPYPAQEWPIACERIPL